MCLDGSLKEVEQAIKDGANVNERAGELSRTPIMVAAMMGRVDVLLLLLNNGAKINAKDSHGLTALFWAAVRGNHKIVEYLHLYGAKMTRDNEGHTPLHLVTMLKKGDVIETIDHLLAGGAELTDVDNRGVTVLHTVALNEDIELLEYYIDLYQMRLKQQQPPLSKGEIKTKFLRWINRTNLPKPTIVEGKFSGGQSALHIAILRMGRSGNQSLVKLLLEVGADPCIYDASFCSSIELLDILTKGKEEEFAEILNLIKPLRRDPRDDHYNMEGVPTTYVP